MRRAEGAGYPFHLKDAQKFSIAAWNKKGQTKMNSRYKKWIRADNDTIVNSDNVFSIQLEVATITLMSAEGRCHFVNLPSTEESKKAFDRLCGELS